MKFYEQKYLGNQYVDKRIQETALKGKPLKLAILWYEISKRPDLIYYSEQAMVKRVKHLCEVFERIEIYDDVVRLKDDYEYIGENDENAEELAREEANELLEKTGVNE